jgi:hypothetical protein
MGSSGTTSCDTFREGIGNGPRHAGGAHSFCGFANRSADVFFAGKTAMSAFLMDIRAGLVFECPNVKQNPKEGT